MVAFTRDHLHYHTEVPSPGVAVFIGFAAQANLARFESARASTLHILSDATDRSLLAPSFIGPFYRSVGAQSTAEPWHTETLAPAIWMVTLGITYGR